MAQNSKSKPSDTNLSKDCTSSSSKNSGGNRASNSSQNTSGSSAKDSVAQFPDNRPARSGPGGE